MQLIHRKLSSPFAMWGALLALGMAGCGDGTSAGSPPEAEGSAGEAEDPAPSSPGRTYQRTLVFMDVSQDTTMFAPWDFESRAEPGGVGRTVRGWLGRGGQWALFMEDDWTAAPTRVPWRILPRGPVRLVVDTDDVVRTIIYREGLRDLSVEVGPTVAEWRGQKGEIYRLSDGTARLSDIATDGVVLDVSTARLTGEPEPVEWGLLIGEDGLNLLLVDPEGPGSYRAWARRGEEELGWPDVEMEWAETRSFERARRPIPVLWRFESDDGELTGEIEATSSHLKALEGEGALLPALGVYEVTGTVRIDDADTPVRGFLRHLQR